MSEPVQPHPPRGWHRLAAAALWLGLWQLAAWQISAPYLLAGPLETLAALGTLAREAGFWLRIGASVGRIAAGLGLAALAAGLLGALSHQSRLAAALLAPPLHLIRAVPVASFVVLALLWVRSGQLSVLITFLIVLPVLYAAVSGGLAQAEPALLEMAEVFQMPWPARLRLLWLPAVYPGFYSACKASVGMGFKAGVAAEVIGLSQGSLGEALYRAKITLATPELFAWTLVILLVSAAVERLALTVLALAARQFLHKETQP